MSYTIMGLIFLVSGFIPFTLWLVSHIGPGWPSSVNVPSPLEKFMYIIASMCLWIIGLICLGMAAVR